MSNLDVANTILTQLGGNRFLVMTGARDLLGDKNSLQFRLPRGAKGGCNSVRITLDASDLYTVSFYKIGRRGLDVTILAEVSMVHDAALASTFTHHTWLDTSL